MKNKKTGRGVRKKAFRLSLKDTLITLCALLLTTALCYLLLPLAGNESFEPLLFVLAVLVISRLTDGYFYGVAASILSVLMVNLLFTYPYYKFNFTITGYPISMLCMLATAIITCALTARIKEQEQLMVAAERERMRSNLLRAVSHDLRTPLTAISGACSALIESGDAISVQEKNKLISQIDEDAQWLIRLVENLLIVTRMDAPGGADITKSPEAAEEVAASALSLFRKNFPQANVVVHVPEEVLITPMDGMLIRQVLLNLLENAAAHAEGATRICLDIIRDGDNALFRVSDDGKGIDQELLPHILNGDYKHSLGSSEDKKRNMGIGLSVCSTIVAAHSGQMRAYNGSGRGAVFEFTLPLDNTDEVDGMDIYQDEVDEQAQP